MAKVIMLSGKVCSGKSTYAERLKTEINAVVLSCDDMMLSIFAEQLGDKHDVIAEKCSIFLYDLAQKIINTNTNVILDWSSWGKEGRKKIIELFKSKNIEIEMHYIKVDEETLNANIKKRNQLVEEGHYKAYYVCENLKSKTDKAFIEPAEDEDYILIENTAK